MRDWTDQQVEQMVGNILRIGVTLAALVVLAGGATYLVQHAADAPHYGVFSGEKSNLRTLSGIIASARELRSLGIVQVGLLLLIATPVARVTFSLFAFLRKRDWAYVAVTAIVLGVLVYSVR
jgi:uncharacterized membrane protein